METNAAAQAITDTHTHTTAVASMPWRELLTCLERGCEHWPTKTVGTALFFAVAGMESELRDLRVTNGHADQRLGRVMRRLIALAPANSKRKTVATADVQAVWQEARG